MAPRRRRAGRIAAACAAAAALALVPALSAQAADDGSNWWYDGFHVAQVQAQGWTGAGVKVAVLDNQINPDLPVFDGTHLTVSDDALCKGGKVQVKGADVSDAASHGSDVTALLIGNGKGKGQVRGIAPGADVTFYGEGISGGTCNPAGEFDGRTPVGEAIHRAVAGGARIISTSLGWDYATPADDEAVAEALAAGVVIIVATPNSANEADQKWAWSYNGVVSVNAFDQSGRIQEDQQIPGKRIGWKETTVIAPGVDFPSVDWRSGSWVISGSSLAAPLAAGIVAVTAQKYPKATGDQLIQSLIHNTGVKDHKLSRDGAAGYGAVSLRHMLDVDPAVYPDVNPLMDKSSGRPTAAQVTAAAASPTPTPTKTTRAATPGALPSSDGGSLAPLLVGGGVLLVLIVAAAIVIVVVMANRKKSKSVGGAV